MNITEVVTYTIAPGETRRKELSFCNVFFCLLVLFIHTIAEPVDTYLRDSIPYFLAVGLWRLSSFVVQGYFFISGTRLFLSPRRQSIGAFWLGRARRVLLPYIAVFCIFALYFTLTGALTLTPASFLYNLVTGKLCGHFYYVILICQFYLLMPLWRQIVQKTDPVLGMLTSLLVMILCKLYLPDVISLITGKPFADNGLLFTSYLFYFLAGAWCARFYDRFRIFLDRYRLSLLVTWAVLGGINWIFIWLNSRGIYYAVWLEVFHILYCIYAILGCLSLGYLLQDQKVFSTPLFKSADKWSYHVYLIHPLVIFLVNSLFWRLGLTSVTLRFGLRTVSVYGSMILLVWLLGKLPKKKKK
ncbi:MAG: acyltransferase [Clostridia bacterium]|nr:acyltransferase [Clostridia bacterium]